MGRATITGGGAEALYNVEIIKDTAKAVERIATITARLAQLVKDIPEAAALVTAAEIALSDALTALDTAIDAFTADQSTKDKLLAAQTAVATATADLQTKRRYVSGLLLEEAVLAKEKTRLQAAVAPEPRAGVWCTDLTEDLEAPVEVGTMEINGEDSQVILTPGGETAKALGKLRPAALHSPAGWFYNKALFPAWQKWKPTYRIGVILSVDYDKDTCSLFIADTRSREQGLLVNQTGTAYNLTQSAVAGWTDFAARNPAFSLVTNTANTTIPLTAQLRQDMEAVNSEINGRDKYRIDTEQYGKLEYWSLMEEGGSGDCEDFALTKAQKLLDRGYSASALHIEVGIAPNGQGHAWLVVQTDQGDYALDINYKDVMKAPALPYTDRRRQTGMAWSNSGVRFDDVAIEYMDGLDSMVFYAGDRVVVQFTDQDWTKPKVIGFESHPRGLREKMIVKEFGGTYNHKIYRAHVSAGEIQKSAVLEVGFYPYLNTGFYWSETRSVYIVVRPYWDWPNISLDIAAINEAGEVVTRVDLYNIEGPSANTSATKAGYVRTTTAEKFFFKIGNAIHAWDENLNHLERIYPAVDGDGDPLVVFPDDTREYIHMPTETGKSYTYLCAAPDGKIVYKYVEQSAVIEVKKPGGYWYVPGLGPPYWVYGEKPFQCTRLGKAEIRIAPIENLDDYVKVCDLPKGQWPENCYTTEPGPYYDLIIHTNDTSYYDEVVSYLVVAQYFGDYLGVYSIGVIADWETMDPYTEHRQVILPTTFSVYRLDGGGLVGTIEPENSLSLTTTASAVLTRSAGIVGGA